MRVNVPHTSIRMTEKRVNISQSTIQDFLRALGTCNLRWNTNQRILSRNLLDLIGEDFS